MNHTYIIAFWSLSPLSSRHFCMDFFVSSLKNFGDIQCLDCRNNRDSRTMHLLRQADLVVVALRQSYREICDFFCNATLRFSRCVYLIVDYFPDREFDLARISFEFRVPPSQIACIPYNSGYLNALPKNASDRRWKPGAISRLCAGTPDFYRELLRTQRIILQALGF
ncbi:MAG: hypothetical protein LUC83_02295 [Clostridiales bacterium]|nr:hypothetical protein [Clostridiales bacterium]